MLYAVTQKMWILSKNFAAILCGIIPVVWMSYQSWSAESLNPYQWDRIQLCDAYVLSFKQGWGELRRNHGTSGPLSFRLYTPHCGVGTHAESTIQLSLKRSGTFMTGACGYPDYVGGGQIICAIEQKGQRLWTSSKLSSTNRVERFTLSTLGGLDDWTFHINSVDGNIGFAHGAWFDLFVLGP